MLQVAASMRLNAARAGTYNGLPTSSNMVLMDNLRRVVPQGLELRASLIFTRDDGMYDSGWWKNSEYARCEHLSLSFQELNGRPIDQQHDRARAWASAFFGENTRKLWIEPPFSEHGKRADVYHYRLFMAPDWRTPILPRAEVYSKQFTLIGWRSWSEVHGRPDPLGQLPP